MSEPPTCGDCRHFNPKAGTCNRPVASTWNAATNQRRSRLCTPATSERQGVKTLARRWKCGPLGLFFERATAPIGGSTIADSDGDDGA